MVNPKRKTNWVLDLGPAAVPEPAGAFPPLLAAFFASSLSQALKVRSSLACV